MFNHRKVADAKGCWMIRIGNAQAFWGDAPDAPKDLLMQQPDLDYLTLDYLSEVSMSILAIQKKKDPSAGYARDCVSAIASLPESPVKIITNGGGLNPKGCADALIKAGVKRRIAIVYGDDVLQQFPEKQWLTANAYFGAEGIVEALKKGAEIVICGRIADPSLTVAPCIYHFNWDPSDYDKIAQATVAGHLIECGTQVTGGISGQWLSIDRPEKIGFPIAEIHSDSSFVITKPLQTEGCVNEYTVKEQLLYEIGDPSCYISPDVTVSFLSLQLEDDGDHRVKVTGAKGKAPLSTYKVSATFFDGYKAEGLLSLFGNAIKEKAKKAGEALVRKVAPESSLVEVLGCGDLVPGAAGVFSETECVLRIAVADANKEVVESFSKHLASLVTSGPPGTTGYTSGRPKVREIFGFESASVEKSNTPVLVEVVS